MNANFIGPLIGNRFLKFSGSDQKDSEDTFAVRQVCSPNMLMCDIFIYPVHEKVKNT